MEIAKQERLVEYIFVVLILLSMLNCIVKNDYNIDFAFYAYINWENRFQNKVVGQKEVE